MRWTGLSLLLGVAGGAAAYALNFETEETFEARAELLVRFGYEYTPPGLGSSGDSMQVRVDPGTALANEVQILTSRPVVEEALDSAPHPGRSAPEEPGALSLAEVLEQVSVSPVEGSSVIGLSVTSPDDDWALAFAEAMIDAYLARRTELFDSDRVVGELQWNREVLAERLEEILGLLGDALENAAPPLRAGIGPQDLGSVLQDWAKVGLDLIVAAEASGNDTPDTEVSLDLLQRSLREVVSSPGEPAPPTPASAAGPTGSDNVELVRTILDLRAETTDALTRTERMLDTATLHGLMSDRVEVLAPPALSEGSGGLSRTQRAIVAGVLAIVAGLCLGLLIEGSRRRT